MPGRPAGSRLRWPPGRLPAGPPTTRSDKQAARGQSSACLCLILATPLRATGRFGANSCTRSRCSRAFSSSKLRKAFWAALKCRMSGSQSACRNPQPHRRSSTQRLLLQTGQSHLSDAPQCRHRADPDFRATGLISVTPVQCRHRNRLNLADPLRCGASRQEMTMPVVNQQGRPPAER